MKTGRIVFVFSFLLGLAFFFLPAPASAAKRDTTPPVVSITNPLSGALYTTESTVSISASASDNVKVSKVEFYDNNTLKGTLTAAPFVYSWSVNATMNGSHDWVAKAYDSSGNKTASNKVTLSVNIASSCIDSGEPVCTSSTNCSERLSVVSSSGTSGTFEAFRNLSLSKTHCAVTHAVIVIHGRSRNPGDYFSYAMDAAALAGESSNSLIVSPYFREETDARLSSDFYWDRNMGSAAQYDWAMGGQSYSPTSVSSYAIIDKLIYFISTSANFPNLQSIVVVGHSAGGQLVQRYALSGNYNNQGLNKTFSYVAANPSSYAYLNDQRPVSGSLTSFAVPDSSSCSSYNKWGYGLLSPNFYVSQTSSSQLISQYSQRKVTYLLGDADTSSDGMDVTCYANLQGVNRYERGTAYFNFMNTFFSGNNHSKVIVPGVAHDGKGMITSSQGVGVIFP